MTLEVDESFDFFDGSTWEQPGPIIKEKNAVTVRPEAEEHVIQAPRPHAPVPSYEILNWQQPPPFASEGYAIASHPEIQHDDEALENYFSYVSQYWPAPVMQHPAPCLYCGLPTLAPWELANLRSIHLWLAGVESPDHSEAQGPYDTVDGLQPLDPDPSVDNVSGSESTENLQQYRQALVEISQLPDDKLRQCYTIQRVRCHSLERIEQTKPAEEPAEYHAEHKDGRAEQAQAAGSFTFPRYPRKVRSKSA